MTIIDTDTGEIIEAQLAPISDLQAGKAGEYLVCADLILKGYIAYPSEQGLPYDIVLDTGKRLLRVQVKTTRKPATTEHRNHTPHYIFNIRRMGNGGRNTYTCDHVDIFAMVGLDTRVVGYLAFDDVKSTMLFRVRELQGRYYDEQSKNRHAQIIRMRDIKGLSFARIGECMGLNAAYVHRVYNGKIGNSHAGQYLDDLSIAQAIASSASREH